MRSAFGTLVVVVYLVGCSADDETTSDWTSTTNTTNTTNATNTSGGTPGYYPGDPSAPAAQPSGDRYDAPGTNPFVVTAHDPLSTFAADVDTASYDIFRRDIERGVLPNPNSVRLEEYVNYFAYAHQAPDPADPAPFAITLHATANPLRSTTLLSVGIKGKQVPWSKRPANLVFLVDVSGSMSAPNKLPLVKKLLLAALDVLDPLDTVAIVTYAGSTAVRLAPTPVSQRGQIEGVIGSLDSGGGTAGGAGITLAYLQAQAGFIEGGINHVLLCTDGDFNVGISSTDALLQLIEDKRKTGITLTALGFGYGNLNDAMMEAITNAGNGVYGVIADADQAVDYANKRLLSTFNLIAKDVKIQVELNPGRVHAYRLLGYENRALADDQFKDDRVDAGEVGSGHTVTALYELVLAGEQIPQPAGAPAPTDGPAADHQSTLGANDLCRVAVRYKAPDAGENDQAAELDLALSSAEVVPSASQAAVDLQWAAGVAALAEILKHSPFAESQQLAAIEQLLADSAGNDPDRLELLSLLGSTRQLLGL